MSCSSYFINTTSLQNRYLIRQNNDKLLSPKGVRHPYTLGLLGTRIAVRYPENLDSDHLVVVHTLPNLGRLGDALGMVSLPRNTIEFVQCWDCTVVTTPPPKFNEGSPPRLQIPMYELLRRKWSELKGERTICSISAISSMRLSAALGRGFSGRVSDVETMWWLSIWTVWMP